MDNVHELTQSPCRLPGTSQNWPLRGRAQFLSNLQRLEGGCSREGSPKGLPLHQECLPLLELMTNMSSSVNGAATVSFLNPSFLIKHSPSSSPLDHPTMSNIRRIKNSVLIDKNTDMRAYYLPATRSILNSNTRCRVSAECSHKKG